MGAYVGFGLWPQIGVGIVVVGLIGWLALRNLALWMVIGMSLMVPLSLALGQPMEHHRSPAGAHPAGAGQAADEQR